MKLQNWPWLNELISRYLLDDWKEILQKAWSFKWMFATALFTAVAGIAAFLTPDFMPMWLIFLIIFISTLGAMVSRFMVQKDMPDDL